MRLQYRNFGDHQALVTNHTVDTGGDHAGIRWYELRDTGSGWGIHQQSTFAPDGDHRWLASAAMNGSGDIGLGYSVSSSATYPSIRFTGRLNADTLNQMTQGEGTLVNGGGSQCHSSGRWGDYSALSVDPIDDCTFWYTQEYSAANSSAGWRTRIGSFKLADCGVPVNYPPTVTLTQPADGARVAATVTLTARATDDGTVTGVEFKVDGVSLGFGMKGSDSWTLGWNTTAYAQGVHMVSAIATDDTGKTGSDSNTVTVDNIPGPTVHVADLDASSTNARRGRWNAIVTIAVRDNGISVVSGATVNGTWGNGASGGASCTTDGSGQCQVSNNNLAASIASHDSSHNPAAGVTVTGSWSGAVSGGASCTTDNAGLCSVSKSSIRGTSATFTVSDILDSLGNSIYDGAASHETSITIDQH